MAPRMDARTLSKLYAIDGPFVTIYLATPSSTEDAAVQLQPWEAPLDEVLVRSALLTGADVRFVGGGTEQAPADGVGALLRYAD